eukprot:3525505-Rhodomonas_salina.1
MASSRVPSTRVPGYPGTRVLPGPGHMCSLKPTRGSGVSTSVTHTLPSFNAFRPFSRKAISRPGNVSRWHQNYV